MYLKNIIGGYNNRVIDLVQELWNGRITLGLLNNLYYISEFKTTPEIKTTLALIISGLNSGLSHHLVL